MSTNGGSEERERERPRKSAWINLGGCNGINLTMSDERRREETAIAERERTRRALIYADMLVEIRRIEYDRLASWPYQPCEEEIDEALAAASRRNKEANTPKAKAVA
jgi:hypothetical protein